MTLCEYKERIQSYTDQLLSPYVRHLDIAKQRPRSFKEFNDAVWETIVLSPFEVLVLDSPIVQRLRRISQLGVVHWTFGCAVHRRFEHSIGAVHKVQSVIDSLNRHRPANDPLFPHIPADIANSLRIAALCHDIGHGFMSHVSENALSTLGKLGNLYQELREAFEHDKVTLSEAAAYYMIGSDSFRSMVDTICQIEPSHEVVTDLCGFAQNCIVGKHVSDRYPLINELISGPFDCDKLDYMTRDAIQTGVPVVTDIKRLAQKVRMVRLTEQHLPQVILDTVVEQQDTYFIQGIALSGSTTVDELMIGRTLLFDKVYRHQKVRAVEAMVSNIVGELIRILPCDELILPLLLCDEDLLEFSRATLGAKLNVKITANQWKKLTYAIGLTERLRDRRLYVRCYAFGSRMPRDPYQHDEDQKLGLEQIRREMSEPDQMRSYKSKIVAEACAIMSILNHDKQRNSDEMNTLIALDPPSPISQASEIARAYLVASDGSVMPFEEGSAQSSGWTSAYPMTRELGFVFSVPEIAEYVYIACETVFRRDYKLRTPRTSRYYAKVNEDKINEVKSTLLVNGYYDTLSRDLRPLSPFLSTPGARSRIKTVSQSLSIFEGVVVSEGDKSASSIVTPERVKSFLNQFDNEEHIKKVLELLERIKIVSRNAIVNATRTFIGQNPNFKRASICPLGSPGDSSAHLTYFLGDIIEQYSLKLCTVPEALRDTERKLLFVDDFIGSGNQSIRILEQLMGINEPTSLAEDHVSPLTDHEKEQLRLTDIGFTFACGASSGLSSLLSRCKQLELKTVGYIDDSEIPKAFDDGESTFKTICKDIGKQLLESNIGTKWSPEKINERSLGYGNDAYLVTFPYNIPTQALTLLWANGTVNGHAWLPLLPRRPKK